MCVNCQVVVSTKQKRMTFVRRVFSLMTEESIKPLAVARQRVQLLNADTVGRTDAASSSCQCYSTTNEQRTKIGVSERKSGWTVITFQATDIISCHGALCTVMYEMFSFAFTITITLTADFIFSTVAFRHQLRKTFIKPATPPQMCCSTALRNLHVYLYNNFKTKLFQSELHQKWNKIVYLQ